MGLDSVMANQKDSTCAQMPPTAEKKQNKKKTRAGSQKLDAV